MTAAYLERGVLNFLALEQLLIACGISGTKRRNVPTADVVSFVSYFLKIIPQNSVKMIEVRAKLIKGPAFFAGENIVSCISFRHVTGKLDDIRPANSRYSFDSKDNKPLSS